MAIERVSIRGKSYLVTLTQMSRTVWVASGIVGNQAGHPPEENREIRGKGASEMSAIADWIRNASYWTN